MIDQREFKQLAAALAAASISLNGRPYVKTIDVLNIIGTYCEDNMIVWYDEENNNIVYDIKS